MSVTADMTVSIDSRGPGSGPLKPPAVCFPREQLREVKHQGYQRPFLAHNLEAAHAVAPESGGSFDAAENRLIGLFAQCVEFSSFLCLKAVPGPFLDAGFGARRGRIRPLLELLDGTPMEMGRSPRKSLDQPLLHSAVRLRPRQRHCIAHFRRALRLAPQSPGSRPPASAPTALYLWAHRSRSRPPVSGSRSPRRLTCCNLVQNCLGSSLSEFTAW